MEENYVKRFVTKDGNKRISIYREESPENPRYTTDEPFHCCDWLRDYTIMTKDEQSTNYSTALNWIRYMLERYGNTKAIIKVLRENAKADKHVEDDDALVYDASRHEWILNSWIARWTDYNGEICGNCWSEEVSWAIKLKYLDASDIVPYLSDYMIDRFADEKYFTDGIKIGSYTFGYYGSVSFNDSFFTDSEGICWLEKDEFLKYGGNSEKYWKSKSLTEIEFLCDEIEAWSNDEVYGFCVEKAVRKIVNVRYPDGEHDDTETEKTEWEETDSCWGFYGDMYKEENLNWILGSAGFKIE